MANRHEGATDENGAGPRNLTTDEVWALYDNRYLDSPDMRLTTSWKLDQHRHSSRASVEHLAVDARDECPQRDPYIGSSRVAALACGNVEHWAEIFGQRCGHVSIFVSTNAYF
jgi:hypothetical protein